MTMAIPVGKYHPSNYKNKSNDNEGATLSTHRRSSSDVRGNLQQYQRDIIEQAAIASGMPIPDIPKPLSPRLRPLGTLSVGPMTPMELEGSSDGYLVAGSQVRVEEAQARVEGPHVRAEGAQISVESIRAEGR
jgi:hypothetical protein